MRHTRSLALVLAAGTLGGCSVFSTSSKEPPKPWGEPGTEQAGAEHATGQSANTAQGAPSTSSAPIASAAPAGTTTPTIDDTVTNPYPYAGFRDVPVGEASDAEPMGFVAPVQRVTFSPVGADFDPVLTPDGSRLVFASTTHRHTSDIYVKDVDGQVVSQLTNDPSDDVMPCVSPDGSRIAFASNRSGSWDIYVMPITGGQAVRVTNEPSDELHPSWSPDATRVAFCRMGEVSARWEIWVTALPKTNVSHFLGYGMFPTWCPVASTGADGADRILFQVARERGTRTFGVWTVDYREGRAGNATELASAANAALINPCWSPDGRQIVFAEVPLFGETAFRQASFEMPQAARLWVQNLDGTGKVRLTEGTTIALMPAWGRDGRLVFMSPRGDQENLWSMDMTPVLAMIQSGVNTDRASTSPAPAVPLSPAPQAPAIATVPEEPTPQMGDEAPADPE